MNPNNRSDRNNPSRQTSHPRNRVAMEPLEDRRLMTGQATGPLAGSVTESSHAAVEMPLHVATAARRAAQTARSPLATPTRRTNTDTPVHTVPDAEFPTAGISSDIVTGVYTPRIKLWGSQRIGDADAHAVRPLGWASDAIGNRPGVIHRAEPAPAPRRALLVEPNPATRAALATLLRSRGWHVTAVPDCAAAEDHLAGHPDAVIVDLDRGETHGEAFLRHIRAASNHTRIAVITDDVRDLRVPALARLHPDAMLSKPINLAALLRSLSASEPNVPPAWN